jgi:hypothetical protein
LSNRSTLDSIFDIGKNQPLLSGIDRMLNIQLAPCPKNTWAELKESPNEISIYHIKGITD